jgi:hypothetical protein
LAAAERVAAPSVGAAMDLKPLGHAVSAHADSF